MIKKLRKQFIIVTMYLMLTAIGILSIIENMYSNYWKRQEMLDILEWYAHSDSFFELDTTDREIFDLAVKPIFSISLTKDLQIKDVEVSTSKSTRVPSKEVIKGVFKKGPDKHRYKSYLYIIDETNDGYLLTITNLSNGTEGIHRTALKYVLIAIACGILFLISYILSYFVTEPAGKAIEREKQFISNVSHELKTPLAAISINAQMLESNLSGNKHLQYIHSETKRMDALIQKLLKLSYLDERGTNIEKKDFNLSNCVEEILLTLESNAFESHIHYEYDIVPNIIYTGVEEDIKQVISILLDNAIKNTPSEGLIKCTLTTQMLHSIITITNTGEGILPEDLSHVFERFYKADQSRNSNSYGLGLAIAKAIIDAHLGDITVASEPGVSTTFTITL